MCVYMYIFSFYIKSNPYSSPFLLAHLLLLYLQSIFFILNKLKIDYKGNWLIKKIHFIAKYNYEFACFYSIVYIGI